MRVAFAIVGRRRPPRPAGKIRDRHHRRSRRKICGLADGRRHPRTRRHPARRPVLCQGRGARRKIIHDPSGKITRTPPRPQPPPSTRRFTTPSNPPPNPPPNPAPTTSEFKSPLFYCESSAGPSSHRTRCTSPASSSTPSNPSAAAPSPPLMSMPSAWSATAVFWWSMNTARTSRSARSRAWR